jgi:hypothetical protein
MAILGGLKEGVSRYLFSVAAKRVIAAAVGYVIGLLTSAKIAMILTQWGIDIDPAAFKTALEGVLTAGTVALHDWLRLHKWFQWM